MNRLTPALVFTLAIFASDARAEKVVLTDPLAGSTIGKQVGGSWKDAGFVPGVGEGHVLYELPKAVTEGRLEVEVQGMTEAASGEPAFFTMYDGRGVTEPVAYSLGAGVHPFRENYFRFNLHWRSEKKALKFVLLTTKPETAAGLDPTTKMAAAYRPTDTVNTRDFVEEPCCKAPGFKPESWHKVAVEWRRDAGGKTAMKILVDGKDIGLALSAGSPYPYTPGVHRIWVGAGPGKYAQTNAALVVRNVRLTSFDDTVPAYDGAPAMGGQGGAAGEGGAGGMSAGGGTGGGDAQGGQGGASGQSGSGGGSGSGGSGGATGGRGGDGGGRGGSPPTKNDAEEAPTPARRSNDGCSVGADGGSSGLVLLAMLINCLRWPRSRTSRSALGSRRTRSP